MSQSTIPPLGPLLAPESSGTDERELTQPLLVASKVTKFHRKNRANRRTRKAEPPTLTLEGAFNWSTYPDGMDGNGEGAFNNERCVRAVAFLLQYCSDAGNREIEGFAAYGLSVVLEKCASDIARAAGQRKWSRERAQEEGQSQ